MSNPEVSNYLDQISDNTEDNSSRASEATLQSVSSKVATEETEQNIDNNIKRARTAYGDLSTVGRTNIFALSSAYGISSERDIIDAPNGSVSNTQGEYHVHNNATESATTEFESSQLGVYIPDYEAIAGIAVRRPSAPTGSQEARWGYYNEVDGAYFGEDSTSPFVARMVNGNETERVRQSNWNIDTLDGSGDKSNPSGLNLDLSDGVICHERLALYNYGRVTFVMLIRRPPSYPGEDVNDFYIAPIHRMAPREEVTLRSQNLPISMYLRNHTTASTFDYYVGGRQFSLLGQFSPERRVKGDRRPNPSSTGSISINTTSWTPILAFRRKSDFQSQQVKIDLFSYSVFSSTDAYMQIRSNATVSGGSYSNPTNVNASETAVETNTNPTSVTISDGEFRYEDMVSSAQGGKTSLSSAQGVDVHVNRSQVVVLAARAISSSGSITSATVQWQELW